MPDATHSQQPKPRNAVQTCCELSQKRVGYCWSIPRAVTTNNTSRFAYFYWGFMNL